MSELSRVRQELTTAARRIDLAAAALANLSTVETPETLTIITLLSAVQASIGTCVDALTGRKEVTS